MTTQKYEEGLATDAEWEIAWLTMVPSDDSLPLKINNNIIQVQVQRKKENIMF